MFHMLHDLSSSKFVCEEDLFHFGFLEVVAVMSWPRDLPFSASLVLKLGRHFPVMLPEYMPLYWLYSLEAPFAKDTFETIFACFRRLS